jgi:hypothetical protein
MTVPLSDLVETPFRWVVGVVFSHWMGVWPVGTGMPSGVYFVHAGLTATGGRSPFAWTRGSVLPEWLLSDPVGVSRAESLSQDSRYEEALCR